MKMLCLLMTPRISLLDYSSGDVYLGVMLPTPYITLEFRDTVKVKVSEIAYSKTLNLK